MILILAVLLSIALPALQRARHAAASGKCKAHLHEIGQIHQIYASEHDGVWPTLDFPIKANGRGSVVQIEQWGATGIGAEPIQQIWAWGAPLRFYADKDPANHPIVATELFSCPVVHRRAADQLQRGILWPTYTSGLSYMYSPAFFTDPSKWLGSGPFAVNWMFARVRRADVRFPAAKAVLVERRSYHSARETPLHEAGGERFNILAADGHVERRAAREAVDPVPIAWDVDVEERASAPFVATPRGARGRDW